MLLNSVVNSMNKESMHTFFYNVLITCIKMSKQFYEVFQLNQQKLHPFVLKSALLIL